MSPLVVWGLLALAVVTVLAGLRFVFLKRPQRQPDWREAFRRDPRSALRELVEDARSREAREAERRGDGAAARAAYAAVLEDLRTDGGDAAAGLKRRALESKIEELERLAAG